MYCVTRHLSYTHSCASFRGAFAPLYDVPWLCFSCFESANIFLVILHSLFTITTFSRVLPSAAFLREVMRGIDLHVTFTTTTTMGGHTGERSNGDRCNEGEESGGLCDIFMFLFILAFVFDGIGSGGITQSLTMKRLDSYAIV